MNGSSGTGDQIKDDDDDVLYSTFDLVHFSGPLPFPCLIGVVEKKNPE